MPSSGLLRWIYLARLTLAAGIFAGALLVWTQPTVTPETTLLATLMLVSTIGFTIASFWHTHVARQTPTGNFLYAQALFDVVLVTAAVHVTGRGESDFAPLYVLVIAEGALLLPLRGGFLIGALATLAYFADAVWGGQLTGALRGVPLDEEINAGVLTRVALFAVIALATAWLGDRLRRTGSQLGEMESKLRQLRLDTDDILGALDTGVVTVDPEGAISYMNRAAEKLLGLTAAEWLGRPGLREMDRVAPGVGTVVQRTLETGHPVARYETHTRAGPEVRVLGLRSTALERDERPWVTVVLQDITDAHQAEAATRRAERLEAVAELAASLAHEIKNPLASIRSAVEQLTGPKARLEARDRDVLGNLVLSESDRLSRLLSGFIEFSRVELKGRTDVNVGEVAREAVEVVRQHPDAQDGPAIDLEVIEAVKVEGDSDLLHRIVFNLVLNAVQHSEDGGTVRVEVGGVGRAEIPAEAAFEAGARLRVIDHGSGMSPEDTARVFDPFFTTRRGGSGLGLALVHRAVQAHGGLIFIDSERGEGTTFTIFLPERLKQGAR